ncbi:MAG: alpha-beta hydrolase superfamily lysophospholipase [Desulforhopalus sp.]|jgi:alpha-beta hydrolase superfamily lysophospholipase
MNHFSQDTRDHEWLDYYDQFPYFSPEKVRDGCHPRIMEHTESLEKAIVLVHGLSDSPYFMTEIGDYFFNNLGYNVYMPLLHCHGLKEPKGMEAVELEEWKANVSFALQSAASKAGNVSIGGLSTGGTLSFYMAATRPWIKGELYLFSAALDLAGGPLGSVGELKERLLRTPLANLLDMNKPLIGENPYRYSHVDIDGAQELARLIKETDTIIGEYSRKNPFPKRVFAAHHRV